MLAAPLDVVDADVDFWAEFNPVMLPGVRGFVDGDRVPWRLTVSADGGFERDGGWCEITELHFGWSSGPLGGSAVLQIDASVESEFRAVEASVRQPLLEYSEVEIRVLRRVLSAIV